MKLELLLILILLLTCALTLYFIAVRVNEIAGYLAK